MKGQYRNDIFNLIYIRLFLIIFFIIFFTLNIYAQEIENITKWDELYKHKLYNATIFQINKIEEISPDLKNYVLGTCYYFIGNYDLAEFYLKKVSSHLYRYRHDPVSYYLGIISFFKNDFLIAATYFNEIASIYNQLEEAGKFLYYFSLSLIEIDKPDLALKYLNIGLNSEYDFYKQYYSFTIAKIYYNLKDFSKAAAEFEKFLFLYANSTLVDDSLYYLGRSYYNIKDLKNAKRAFSSIVNLYRNSEYYYSSLYYLGHITGNKIYYEQIISNNPLFELIDFVYYYLGKILYDEGEFEKAYQFFNQSFLKTENQLLKYNCIVFMIKIKGDIPISYLDKLNSERRKPIIEFLLSNFLYFKNYEKIFLYEKSRFKDEILSNPFTLVILGKAYLDLENITKSLEMFSEALKLNPSDYKLYFFIGYCYYKLKDYDNSQKLFNKVILESAIEPYYGYYSYLYSGILELKKGNFKNAQSYFEQILLKYPTYKNIAEVYYFLSIVYYNLRDFRKSLSAIEFAYASNISGNLRLAIIYQYIVVLMRFDINKTAQLYDEYVSFSDDFSLNLSLAIKIAEYYFSLSKYDVAKIYYDQALKYCEDDNQKIELNLQIATIYYNLKDYNSAFSILEELVNLNNNYRKKDILFFYLNTSIQLKKIESSKLILLLDESQINDFSHFIVHFINLYKETDQFQQAINYIDSIISKYPDINNSIKFELLINKAQILIYQNKFDNAFQLYLGLYDNYEEKRKDLELYLIDCAIKLKKIDFLIEKILVLLNYNDDFLTSNAYYLLLKLFFNEKIDEKFINELKEKNIIKADDIKYSLFFGYIDNRFNLKKQNEYFKQYLSSKNSEIAYWARFFYAISLYDSKDYKNARLLFESLIQISDDIQRELLYYFLALIEKIEGKELKYWDLLTKDYPFSLFL